jgi:sulfate adenylyltransferase subunit 2
MLENIDLVPLYLSAQRLSWIDESSGQILALDDDRMLPYLNQNERKSLKERQIRSRTLGCYPQTGAIESDASCVQDIIAEMLITRQSERQGRLLDQDQAGSMEKKKREGYF